MTKPNSSNPQVQNFVNESPVLFTGEFIDGSIAFQNTSHGRYRMQRSTTLSDGTIVYPTSRFCPKTGKLYAVTIAQRYKRPTKNDIIVVVPTAPGLLNSEEWLPPHQLRKNVKFRKDGRNRLISRCDDTGKFIRPDRFWKNIKAGVVYPVVLVDAGTVLIAKFISDQVNDRTLLVLVTEGEEGLIFCVNDYMKPHEILHIPFDSSVKEIKKAFNALSKEYHPDNLKVKKETRGYDIALSIFDAGVRAKEMMLANLSSKKSSTQPRNEENGQWAKKPTSDTSNIPETSKALDTSDISSQVAEG